MHKCSEAGLISKATRPTFGDDRQGLSSAPKKDIVYDLPKPGVLMEGILQCNQEDGRVEKTFGGGGATQREVEFDHCHNSPTRRMPMTNYSGGRRKRKPAWHPAVHHKA